MISEGKRESLGRCFSNRDVMRDLRKDKKYKMRFIVECVNSHKTKTPFFLWPSIDQSIKCLMESKCSFYFFLYNFRRFPPVDFSAACFRGAFLPGGFASHRWPSRLSSSESLAFMSSSKNSSL